MNTITFTRKEFDEYANLYNECVESGEKTFIHKNGLHSIYDNFIIQNFTKGFENTSIDKITLNYKS